MRRTVKDLLSAGKDATELMLDLAFASVFLDEEKLAREVLRLEDRMGEAVRELRIMCMLASRSPEDAQQLAGVLARAVTFGDGGDLHSVHLPLALLAVLAVVVHVVRRVMSGEAVPARGGLLTRTVLVVSFLLAEAGAAEGFGTHLLRDPWVLVAPAGVLLAHLCMLTLGALVVPLATVPAADDCARAMTAPSAGAPHGRAIEAAAHVSHVLGRAPPVLV